MQEKIEIKDIKLDSDLKGLSIAIIKYVEADGKKFYSNENKIIRRAFRKYISTFDSNGKLTDEEIVNPNFEKEIDEWVKQENFIKDKFNF